MRSRRKFGGARAQNEEMGLQITSMADIFTIILVFLLKSYASGTLDVTPAAGINLPTAKSGLTPGSPALRVEISDSAIVLDGKSVMKMADFHVSGADVSPDGSLRPLEAALKLERARETGKPGSVADPRIIVIADQHAPYATVKTVLASAATQGYTDVKLAVSSDE